MGDNGNTELIITCDGRHTPTMNNQSTAAANCIHALRQTEVNSNRTTHRAQYDDS